MSGISLRLLAVAVLLWPAALSAEALSLDECLDLAARGNLSILQQQERLEIARADVDVQAAAGWPRLFVSSSARYVSELARLEMPFLPPSYQGTEMGAKDQYDIYAGLTVPIFTGMRTRYQALSAGERLTRAAEEGRQLQNLVDLRVRQLYYALEGNILGQGVLSASLRRVENHLDRSRKLLREGQATAFDTLDASTRRLEIATHLGSMRHAFRETAAKLAALLNIEAVDSIEGSIPAGLPEETGVLADYEALARGLRPELAAGRSLIREAEYKKGIVRSSYFPQVSLAASYHYARPGVNYFSDEWMDYYSVGVELQWEIWNRGRRGNESRMQDNLIRAAGIEQEKAWREIRREVAEAYENLADSAERIVLRRRLVEMEEERYKIALERHGQGLATAVELGDAEESLTSAQLEFRGSEIEFMVNRAAMDYATGAPPRRGGATGESGGRR
ncbi:MAG: TolC family protein [Candidatus Krumholzibacteria bacterium]|nr:TolC family protein [Candidatus Krumholzibacteria bacterium]